MKSPTLSILSLVFTAAAGLIVGTVLGPQFGTWIARFLLVAGVLFLVFFWRPMERTLHTLNLQEWSRHHEKGRLYFILTRYLLLRGCVMTAIFVAPAFIVSAVPFTDLRFVGMALAVVALTTISLGYVEWADCEREYHAAAARRLASRAREDTASTN